MVKLKAESIMYRTKEIMPWNLYDIDGVILDEKKEYETELGPLRYEDEDGWIIRPFAGYENEPPADYLLLNACLVRRGTLGYEPCKGYIFLKKHPRLFKLAIKLYQMREKSGAK